MTGTLKQCAVAAFAVALAAPAGAAATFPGHNGKIGFTLKAGNASEIAVVKESGGGRRTLTNNHKPDFDPDFSPNGKRIAFVRGSAVWTMDAHGGRQRKVRKNCSQPSWDPEQALALIERERIDTLYLAPTLFYDLVHHPRFGDANTSPVRAVAYAGSPMTSALVDAVAAAFEPEIFVNHYGSTEIYTFSVHRDQRAKPGCAGRAALNARLRLDPPDEGEILCHMSSDEAFAGYWNRPDADAKAISDGWYRTGDVGRLDEEGDLWVVGRVDDMVVSGGENIHPVEVEDVVARAPGVGEVAVVGAPDDRWGQRVVAYVVANGAVTAEELDAFCLASDSLARFKRPREYRFVAELPKSPSGKILRRMLRDDT